MFLGSPCNGVYSEKLHTMVWSNGYWGIDGPYCMSVDLKKADLSTKVFKMKDDVKCITMLNN